MTTRLFVVSTTDVDSFYRLVGIADSPETAERVSRNDVRAQAEMAGVDVPELTFREHVSKDNSMEWYLESNGVFAVDLTYFVTEMPLES